MVLFQLDIQKPKSLVPSRQTTATSSICECVPETDTCLTFMQVRMINQGGLSGQNKKRINKNKKAEWKHILMNRLQQQQPKKNMKHDSAVSKTPR